MRAKPGEYKRAAPVLRWAGKVWRKGAARGGLCLLGLFLVGPSAWSQEKAVSASKVTGLSASEEGDEVRIAIGLSAPAVTPASVTVDPSHLLIDGQALRRA